MRRVKRTEIMNFRSIVLIIAITTMILTAGVVLLGCRPSDEQRGRQTSSPAGPPRCPIDGMETTEAALARRPLAVMIENSPRARPQTGLATACVVYEAITEGGITRFMAVYLHQDPSAIGPVRSARPHFIHLMREYDAAYVHCGESYEALQILARDNSIHNLSELEYHEPFWRDRTRRAPHNLYTSSAKLHQWMAKHGWEEPVDRLPAFTGSGQMPSTAQPATTVQLNFSGAVHYKLKFVYNASAGGYYRYMDGKLHVDRVTGKPLVAKNILIQRVWAERDTQDTKHGTYLVKVTGSGIGQFVTAGKAIPMQWAKLDDDRQTSYTDNGGRALPFQTGQTWVEIIPTDGTVTVSGPSPDAAH